MPESYASSSPDHIAVVIALKDIVRAKTRMDELTPALRQRLTITMLMDTVQAWLGVTDTVIVVSGSPLVGTQLRAAGLTVTLLPDPGLDLNTAFTAGADHAAEHGAGRIIASVADLPALTADTAADIVAAAEDRPRWMVPDHAGEGTTMLGVSNAPLDPAFEHGSAERHRASGAEVIDAPASARCDVDDLRLLADAHELGLGPHTTRLMYDGELLLDERAFTVTNAAEGDDLTVVDDAGRLLRLPRTCRPGPRLAAGQRLHGVVQDGVVHSAWW